MQPALCSLQNGTCVQFEGAGLPQGIQRPSVCVIYPSWKIQTYKCAHCCESKGILRDSSSPHTKQPPTGFLNVHLCRFQPGQRKGSAGGQQAYFLSLALKALRETEWGIQRSPQALGSQNCITKCQLVQQNHASPTSWRMGPTLRRLKPFVQRGFILVQQGRTRPVLQAFQIPALTLSPPHPQCTMEQCPGSGTCAS